MPGAQSAAYTLLVPGGVAHDPVDAMGAANLLSELVTRGAGPRDSRAVAIDLDNLGLQRGESTETFHTSFVGATIAGNLLPALEIVADVVRRPHLDEEHLEFCKEGILQEIRAIEDEPTQKLSIELRRQVLPGSMGWPILGLAEHVAGTTVDRMREHYAATFRPNGAILGVAGRVEFEAVKHAVERLFGDWAPKPERTPTATTTEARPKHLASDKVQTHIGVTYASVPYGDPDYYNAHGAVGVLSGGMSARLFTEVREKRGLCYTVSASYSALKDRGFVLCHAGTTNERASETLDVLLAELERLKDGIEPDEVERVQAGLKSSLIMQEESSGARASVLARSWYSLGRVRTVDEVAKAIDALTPTSILDYLARYPTKDFNVVTLGPKPLRGAGG